MSYYPDDYKFGPPEPAARFCDNCGVQKEYDDEKAEVIGSDIYCEACYEFLFVYA
jgi:hypothetical protein